MVKKQFVKAVLDLSILPVDMKLFGIGPYSPTNIWDDRIPIVLAFFDFRYLPGHTKSRSDSLLHPFFECFILKYKEVVKDPSLETQEVWYWIMSDGVHREQALNLVAKLPRCKVVSSYVPCSNEHMYDVRTSQFTSNKLLVLFLVRDDVMEGHLDRGIPTQFFAPNHNLYQAKERYHKEKYCRHVQGQTAHGILLPHN
jgi:hypothetical protein